MRRGRGAQTRFTITPKGRQHCAMPDPYDRWWMGWDQQWRLITFDVPEARRRDRVTLWRELRARRLGLLQRSVWIWPHSVEKILHDVIRATGGPECFAGFECSRVFLCTNTDLVRTAWDFDAIHRAHHGYLTQMNELLVGIRGATTLETLARAVRRERLVYEGAMSRDPLLPNALWPKGYLGHKVWENHARARAGVKTRLVQLLRNG